MNNWDTIKEAKQSWQSAGYDYEKKKWLDRPVFTVKYKWSNRFEVLPIREAVKLIGTIFPLTQDLEEWLKNGKYSWVLEQPNNQKI
ncbi:MAG: hypothetical protein AAF620_15245 [Bacteroidota bacterium]